MEELEVRFRCVWKKKKKSRCRKMWVLTCSPVYMHQRTEVQRRRRGCCYQVRKLIKELICQNVKICHMDEMEKDRATSPRWDLKPLERLSCPLFINFGCILTSFLVCFTSVFRCKITGTVTIWMKERARVIEMQLGIIFKKGMGFFPGYCCPILRFHDVV